MHTDRHTQDDHHPKDKQFSTLKTTVLSIWGSTSCVLSASWRHLGYIAAGDYTVRFYQPSSTSNSHTCKSNTLLLKTQTIACHHRRATMINSISVSCCCGSPPSCHHCCAMAAGTSSPPGTQWTPPVSMAHGQTADKPSQPLSQWL